MATRTKQKTAIHIEMPGATVLLSDLEKQVSKAHGVSEAYLNTTEAKVYCVMENGLNKVIDLKSGAETETC